MGCNCGKRRALTAQAINNIRNGDLAAARQNAARFAQSVRVDLRNLGRTLQSPLLNRPLGR